MRILSSDGVTVIDKSGKIIYHGGIVDLNAGITKGLAGTGETAARISLGVFVIVQQFCLFVCKICKCQWNTQENQDFFTGSATVSKWYVSAILSAASKNKKIGVPPPTVMNPTKPKKPI